MEAGNTPSRSNSDGPESLRGLSLGHIFQTITDYRVVPYYASLFFRRQHAEILPAREYLPSIYRLGGGFRTAPPEFSQFDLLYARSGAALWLCCHALPLFTEIDRALQRYGGSGHLDPVVLTELALDYLTTSMRELSTTEQARYLSHLMLTAGIGLSGETDWGGKLKAIAIEQASFPHACAVSPLIQGPSSLRPRQSRVLGRTSNHR